VELLAVFFFGFLVGSALWLGLWFLQLRPARGAALRETETILRAKETALRDCTAAQDHCRELKAKLEIQNKQLDAKLKEALIGWGGCIKGKAAPETQAQPKPNAPY
jgi:gas vesicle protein